MLGAFRVAWPVTNPLTAQIGFSSLIRELQTLHVRQKCLSCFPESQKHAAWWHWSMCSNVCDAVAQPGAAVQSLFALSKK